MLCLGIDVGTSNSCVYVARDASPELVMSDMGAHLTPSVVAYTAQDEVLVGESARQQQAANPLNTFIEFKRCIGRSYEQRGLWKSAKHWVFKLLKPNSSEPDNAPRYAAVHAGDVLRLTATDLYTVLLLHLITLAKTQENGVLGQVVVTVPAHFDHVQRQSTVKAVRNAGVPEECPVSVLNEPTAATLAYLDHNSNDFEGNTVVVFDLGAGTLDVTCVRAGKDILDIIGSEGCSDLGGSDFDQRLIDLAVAYYKKTTGKDLKTNKRRMVAVREACERAKKTLTVANATSISVGEDADPVRVTRGDFERAIAPELKRCAAVVSRLLDRLNVAPQDVSHIIMCGGSSRVPGVHRTVQAVFREGAKLLTNVNADECVAKGACLHAIDLMSKSVRPVVVKDVASHTIGIRTGRSTMLPMVRQGDALPATKTQTLVPMLKSQRYADIAIYQGDSKNTEENRCLGSARLDGLRDGHPSVLLKITVSSGGIIEVNANDEDGNKVSTELRVA